MCALCLLLLALHAPEAAARALDVPFVRQDVEGCGSASVAMVMQYWIANGGVADPDAADAGIIHRTVYEQGSKGISGLKLRDYLESNGFRAWVIDAREDDLHQHLQKGRPMIVCLQVSRSALHYVVVTGVDTDKDRIVFHDPARGASMAHNLISFRKMWAKTGNWALLAVPKATH